MYRNHELDERTIACVSAKFDYPSMVHIIVICDPYA